MGTDFERTKDVEITEDVSFQDMMLSPRVLAGLTKCNFEKPSPIQLRAIPIGRCGLGKSIQHCHIHNSNHILALGLFLNEHLNV